MEWAIFLVDRSSDLRRSGGVIRAISRRREYRTTTLPKNVRRFADQASAKFYLGLSVSRRPGFLYVVSPIPPLVGATGGPPRAEKLEQQELPL